MVPVRGAVYDGAMFTVMCWCAMAMQGDELKLASLFGDGMVLQRDVRAPIWGLARPGSEVRVRGSWSEAEELAIAGPDGQWRVELATPAAGGPHEVRLRGSNELVVRDVWSGEVWLVSGQSNMEWKLRPGELGGVMEAEKEIAAARFSRIRHFDVENRIALRPASDVRGRWSVCDPSTVGEFSAVGYFFARELERELDVPIGIVNATWSGTRIEAWVDESVASSCQAMSDEWPRFVELRKTLEAPNGARVGSDPQAPTVLFNGMIAPLAPYALRGFLWYQGESNRGNFAEYAELQPALVSRWREVWGGEAKPFYYVQIAPFAYADDRGETGALRDVQRLCMSQLNTGMISTLDIGDPADIHPRNKAEVGRRLSLWALAKTYGRTELVHSGPLMSSCVFSGAEARVKFTHIADGLISGGDHLTGFEVAGADGVFFKAMAHIEGDTVAASARAVSKPVAVRYGFKADGQPILFNSAWLPAAAFRSDAWKIE